MDDPANFTAGNSQGMTAASSSSSGGNDTDSATSIDSASGSATTSGPPMTTGNDTTAGVTTDPPTGNCGNGVIDPGEQCDGADLQNFTCNDLGLGGGGTLACDAGMCTFDTSMCMSTTGGTSG